MKIAENYRPIDWNEIFNKIDTDNDGLILRSELRYYLLRTPVSDVPLSERKVDAMLRNVDYNDDGFISLQEFHGLVNIPLDPGTRSAVRRALVNTALSITPKSQRSHADRIYIEEYMCCPPPLLVPFLALVQIGVFIYYAVTLGNVGAYQPVPWESPLIYNPRKRVEAWRFVSYMLLHAGYAHVVSNVVVMLFLGIPLEMVHRWWRILILFMCGVVAGSIAASIFDPKSFLVGSSGGVYALIAAHLANVIMNWGQMPFNWVRLVTLILLIGTDIGVFIHMTVNQTDTRISYAAHLAGFLAGLLVGMVTLRNLKEYKWEVILKWTGLAIFIVAILAGIVIQAAFPETVGLLPSSDSSSKLGSIGSVHDA